MQHLEEFSLINSSQHGFRHGRSTLTQLLSFYDNILTNIEGGSQVDVLFVDYEKCFDKIDHKILLSKLSSVGIKGKALAWIKNFLGRRTFKVRVDGTFSNEAPVISGVPQGTVLGPLLMLVMNSDVDEVIKNGVIGTFADDTKIMNTIKTLQDTQNMQEDLQNLESYTTTNNMQMNGDKFVLLRYNKTFNQPLLLADGTAIKEAEGTKDLGIWMSNDAKFTQHITNVSRSCQTIASMVFRSFKTRDNFLLLTLLKSLILPKLDYCSILYFPTNLGDLRKLEQIQSNFTMRMNCGRFEDGKRRNYWERLQLLNLYSIERRIERYGVIMAWKILHGLVVNPGICFKNREGRNGIECVIPKFCGTQRENSFLVHGPRLFNALPKDLREFPLDSS